MGRARNVLRIVLEAPWSGARQGVVPADVLATTEEAEQISSSGLVGCGELTSKSWHCLLASWRRDAGWRNAR